MYLERNEIKMKKVLFTATVDTHILAFHVPYLKYFKEQGYEVHVATNGDAPIPYCDKKIKICIERSPFKLRNLKAINQLKRVIDEEQYDIIHTHTPMGSVITRLAARKARKRRNTKVIYTAHGFHFYKGAPVINWLIYYPVERILSKYTDVLITVNEEDYERAKKSFKANKIRLIHGVGVDENKFNIEMKEIEKKELRNSLGINEDDFVIINVGELNKNKNQILLIEAMRSIKNSETKIKALIAGKGELEEEYRRKIDEYGLQDTVKLLGYRTDIPQLLKISDCLTSLSYREGLPVNVIEGIVIGIPVIATNCRGNRDLIEDGVNGFCMEKNDVESLIKVIEMIKKGEMSLDNRVDTNTRYYLSNIKEQYIQIYEEVL